MERLPEYLKRGIIDTDKTKFVRGILKNHSLNTVCEHARCPNKSECYAKDTATFLIMGNVCTRNCRFCNISVGKPLPLDKNEPQNVAKAVKDLNLKYVVITSVTRDDVEDYGAQHFVNTIEEIRKTNKDVKIEILTPDFKFVPKYINNVIEAKPNVFNHNIETVERVFKSVRPQGNYKNSLGLLLFVKQNSENILTKSGLMVGLGETKEEIIQTLEDLYLHKCDIVTMGQYIQPSKKHTPVIKYYKPEEYEELKAIAYKIGIKHCFFAPLVRSSYKASEVFN